MAKLVEKTIEFVQQTTRIVGCFICNGPNRVRDCPKISTVMTIDENGESNSKAFPRFSLLQLMNVIHGETFVQKSLMHVHAIVNGVQVKPMVDSGATHNFVATRDVAKLGLKLENDSNQIKVVNRKTQKIHGVANNVLMQVDEWNGTCSLLCVPLDDFDLIFDMNFILKAKVALIPTPWWPDSLGRKSTLHCADLED